jgi:hypothetical protein
MIIRPRKIYDPKLNKLGIFVFLSPITVILLISWVLDYIVDNYSVIFFTTGFLHFIVILIFPNGKPIKTIKDDTDYSKKEKHFIRARLVNILLLSFLGIFLLNMELGTDPSPFIFGIALFVFLVGLSKRRDLNLSLFISLASFLIIYSILTQTNIFIHIPYITAFPIGLVILESTNALKMIKHKHGANVGIWLFLLVLLSVAGGGLAYGFQDLISRDQFQWIWVGLLVFGVIALISASIQLIFSFSKTWKNLQTKLQKIFTSTRNNSSFVEFKKPIRIISIACMAVTPLFLTGLFLSARLNTVIQLDTPMYDVDGNLVQSVTLTPSSGKILFYSKNPNGTVHDELIRPGKSIRIGGYYYGYGDGFDKSEVPHSG